MKVTDVRMRLNESKNNDIKAFVDVTFDDELVVHGITVYKLEGREPRMAMPAKKKNNTGKFVDIVHPLNKEFRNYLETAVLVEFNKATNGKYANE